VAVGGRTESVAPVIGMVSGYNAAEAIMTKSMGETTLAEGVEVFSTVDARVDSIEETDRESRHIFLVEPRMRVPFAGLVGVELECFEDGESTPTTVLGIFVLGVRNESSTCKVGMEATVSASADETISNGGHARNPVNSVAFQRLAAF
jgi:hypothetical protein